MDIDKNNLPKHIGIIMDGNGRWAKKQSLIRSYGHKAGMNSVIEIVEHSKEMGIEILTLYAFSTENWKRPKDEVGFIMDLLIKYIYSQLDKLINNGVRINILGDYSKIPKKAQISVNKALEATSNNNSMILNIALNYGGRDEIINASKCIAQLIKDEKIDIDDIDDELFKSHLYTSNQVDPDLIIRTGAEQRLSNFLTYQGVYAELYFTDTLWPDFDTEDFDSAIQDYQHRKRRYGGL